MMSRNEKLREVVVVALEMISKMSFTSLYNLTIETMNCRVGRKEFSDTLEALKTDGVVVETGGSGGPPEHRHVRLFQLVSQKEAHLE